MFTPVRYAVYPWIATAIQVKNSQSCSSMYMYRALSFGQAVASMGMTGVGVVVESALLCPLPPQANMGPFSAVCVRPPPLN